VGVQLGVAGPAHAVAVGGAEEAVGVLALVAAVAAADLAGLALEVAEGGRGGRLVGVDQGA